MTKIRDKSDYEKKGTETTSVPSQFDNKDYGKKRKAKTHSFVVKNTTTGQVYGYKTVAEMRFMDYLDEVLEESDKSDDTRLPASVTSEIVGLIKKGAKDLQQAWKNTFELVHTAYHVANVKRPHPTHKGAWKQYEDMLKHGVKALADTRGLSGMWRSSSVAFKEGFEDTPELDQYLMEATGKRQHRIFVRVKNIGFDDSEKEFEVAADSLSDVIHSFQHQARRNGKHVRIEHDFDKKIVRLIVHIKGVNKTRDEQIIQLRDLSD